MESEKRVWMSKNEVARHSEKACRCHPMKPECCGRSVDLPHFVTTEAVDAIDRTSFAWHVEPPCEKLPEAAGRVTPRARARYIGDTTWREMVKKLEKDAERAT